MNDKWDMYDDHLYRWVYAWNIENKNDIEAYRISAECNQKKNAECLLGKMMLSKQEEKFSIPSNNIVAFIVNFIAFFLCVWA